MAAAKSRIKSCSECRQQKQRCDIYQDFSQPCTRCKRLNINCQFSTTFKRRKRQTKAELLKELNELRQISNQERTKKVTSNSRKTQRQLSKPSELDEFVSKDTFCQPSELSSPCSTAISNDLDETLFRPPNDSKASEQITSVCNIDSRLDEVFDQSSHSFIVQASIDQPGGDCGPEFIPDFTTIYVTAQCLNGVEISGNKIADCISLFYRYYAPQLPGLFDEVISPDNQYNISPFLFWTMVYAGSRKYHSDPTILGHLANSILNLAFPSLLVPKDAVNTIKAVLILCNWPLPTSTLYRDPSHSLAGAAMQLAVQNGLHALCNERDFAKRPTEWHAISKRRLHKKQSTQRNIQNPSFDSEIINRTRLWIHCLVSFQSTSLCDGLPFIGVSEPATYERNFAVHSIIPATLSTRYTIHRLLTEAVVTIRRNVNLESEEWNPSLKSLVQIYDDQIQNASPLAVDDMAQLSRSAARVCIRAFHFFEPLEKADEADFLQLYSAACEVIKISAKLDGVQEFGSHSSQYFSRILGLSAYVILRIFKSHLRDRFGFEDAEEHYFKAIEISKNRSVQHDDIDALNATMLTQLWSSRKMFRQSNDYSDSLHLDLRKRMFMSVAFDSFWWWLREFGELSESYRSIQHGGINCRSSFSEPSRSVSAINFDENSASILNLMYQNPEFCLPGYPGWDWAASMLAADINLATAKTVQSTDNGSA